MRALALGLAACCALNLAGRALLPPARRDPLGMRLQAESAVEDAALFGLGMRRLAADLGLIRLLVYYGTPEDSAVEQDEKSWGGGVYPQLAPRAMRILDIDPSFSYVALYAAGALAFNLDRPDDALRVLEYALARNPGNLEFQAYIGAIGFHRHGDMKEVIRLLEPRLASPDCPTMIKSMMAFLYWKAGLRDKSLALYKDIAENSRDWGYRTTAERMLQELRR